MISSASAAGPFSSSYVWATCQGRLRAITVTHAHERSQTSRNVGPGQISQRSTHPATGVLTNRSGGVLGGAGPTSRLGLPLTPDSSVDSNAVTHPTNGALHRDHGLASSPAGARSSSITHARADRVVNVAISGSRGPR